MAEDAGRLGDDASSGRIRREDADQVLIAALIVICAGVFEDSDRDLALYLAARALPLASASTRMQAIKPVARDVLEAAKGRRSAAGASAWMRANRDLRCVLASDALARALALVRV